MLNFENNDQKNTESPLTLHEDSKFSNKIFPLMSKIFLISFSTERKSKVCRNYYIEGTFLLFSCHKFWMQWLKKNGFFSGITRFSQLLPVDMLLCLQKISIFINEKTFSSFDFWFFEITSMWAIDLYHEIKDWKADKVEIAAMTLQYIPLYISCSQVFSHKFLQKNSISIFVGNFPAICFLKKH